MHLAHVTLFYLYKLGLKCALEGFAHKNTLARCELSHVTISIIENVSLATSIIGNASS